MPVAIAGPIAERPKPTRLSVPSMFSYLSLGGAVCCAELLGRLNARRQERRRYRERSKG